MSSFKFYKYVSFIIKIAVLITFVAVTIIFPINIFAKTPERIDTQKLDDYLESMVLSNRIPGLAVAVVQDNQVVFQKGYGQAKIGQQVTPKTQFYLGSVSKSFTGLAIMQLVEQGKLELDAPVQKYLTWFQVADAEASKKITIRNLLNHTSGLSEGGDPGAANYSPTLIEQIELMKIAKLTAQVGEKYQYDSQNYRILALLIEQVSGQTFGNYLNENIFTPLGMNNTTVIPEKFNNLAQGHGQMFGFPILRKEKFQPAGIGSGYIVSTAEDMGNFIIAMLSHGRLNEKSLITEQSWTTIMTPPEGIKSEYGMGWVITTMNGEKTIYHGGSLTNYQAFVMILPEKNTGFVFLSNQNGIIPMFTVFNTLKKSMAKLLVDNSFPSFTSYYWIYILLSVLMIITVAWQIYRISKLSNWWKKSYKYKPWRRWSDTLINLLIPLLFFGVPFFAKTFMGASSASWRDAYNMIPDVVLWLQMTMFLNLVIAITKLLVLLRHQYLKVR
jgi:CubicO group peptidase (beta-lactamase class C family)